MPCNCGQKREALTAAQQAPALPSRRAVDAGAKVTLRSLNPSAVAITALSGTRYQFQEMGATLPVEKADVDVLLATRLFERAWVQ